jgi:elongation factor 1 alpha-like protein
MRIEVGTASEKCNWEARQANRGVEQLRLGTIKVKELLDSNISVTDAQIRESLWHYFYDVEKTVAYLISRSCRHPSMPGDSADGSEDKAAPPQKKTADTTPKKQKATSKFDQAASAAGIEMSTPGKQITSCEEFWDIHESARTASSLRSIAHRYIEDVKLFGTRTGPALASAHYGAMFPLPAYKDHDLLPVTNFFWDTPWGNVPSHRLGEITVERIHPRGGLLGGSSKPSKLAALAAARKKKQDDAKNAAASHAPENDAKDEADTAVSLLDRLSVKSKGPNDAPLIRKESDKARPSRYVRRRSPSPEPELPKKEEDIPPESSTPDIEFPNLRATPSIFASVLCGSSAPSSTRQGLKSSSFPLPYANVAGFADANPFARPSPDDVVLSAQAKGVGRG